MFKKIALFGLGLIGGSFALSLKNAKRVEQVVGVTNTFATTARALELGIIDVAYKNDSSDLKKALAGADLVLIAAPVAQTYGILKSIEPYLEPHTVVTDAGSTKSDVIIAARAALSKKISQFVPGHPIAGLEKNGPDAAINNLYINKKVVLTTLPENTKEAIEKVSLAWHLCGASIHHLTPELHDTIFASVSHLPHLLAYALVDEMANKSHANLLFEYAASGFRDFTRIAASSPQMWCDITVANQAALLTELDAYIVQLNKLRQAIANEDTSTILTMYTNAQKARLHWKSN